MTQGVASDMKKPALDSRQLTNDVKRAVNTLCRARLLLPPVVLALVANVGPAVADTVHLRSGEKLIGKVITDEKDKLVIKSQALGKIEVPRDRIERVEFDPPTDV